MKIVTSILFYLFSLPLGALCLWWGFQAVDEGYRSNSWPCADGIIERVSETPHLQGRRANWRGYELSFAYSFSHNGTRYEGDRLTTDDLFYGSVFLLGIDIRNRLRSQYVPGTHVSVCYDPAVPAESAVLRPGIHFGAIFRTMTGFFFLFFAALVAVFERRKARSCGGSRP